MPRIFVTIEWDHPDDPLWLTDDNVSLALHAHCPNTHFTVNSVWSETLLRAGKELLQLRAKLLLISAPYRSEMEGLTSALANLSTAVYKIEQGGASKPPDAGNQ